MPQKWLTMADYAKLHQISREAVRQAVKAGRIEHNGRTGRACRVRGEISGSSKISRPNDPIEEALQAARIEKISLNTELQKLKNKEMRDALFREWSGILIDEYLRAFTPVKPWLHPFNWTRQSWRNSGICMTNARPISFRQFETG